MSSASRCNVLMIYPRFGAGTFWNFAAACELFNARYPTTPLGLITVAALLPAAWTIRLVDRNTEELAEDDLEWADLVMTGGMLPQYFDTIEIIDLCRAQGKPVVVGGPGVTSVPHLYSKANFQVLGEAEGIIDKFVEAWDAGARDGVFEAEKFTIDVTKSPVPQVRPLEGRALSLCRRAILARLPVHLRVLRHHRALRAGSPRQNQRADAARAGDALSSRLPRSRRLRRRQPHRQQEGGQSVPA